MTNIGDTVAAAPILTIETSDGGTEDAIPHHEYLEPGQTVIMSYIIHHGLWTEGVFSECANFYLGYGSAEETMFEIGNIYVTDRALEN